MKLSVRAQLQMLQMSCGYESWRLSVGDSETIRLGLTPQQQSDYLGARKFQSFAFLEVISTRLEYYFPPEPAKSFESMTTQLMSARYFADSKGTGEIYGTNCFGRDCRIFCLGDSVGRKREDSFRHLAGGVRRSSTRVRSGPQKWRRVHRGHHAPSHTDCPRFNSLADVRIPGRADRR